MPLNEDETTEKPKELTPEEILNALIDVESKGNPDAVSSVGAVGLTQVMPEMQKAYGASENFAKDPEEQKDIGLKILKDEYKRFKNNMPLALAAYNAGSPAVIRAMKKAGYSLKDAANITFDDIKDYLPDETQNYVPKIYSSQNKIAASKQTEVAYGGGSVEGGAGLTTDEESYMYSTAQAQEELNRLIEKRKELDKKWKDVDPLIQESIPTIRSIAKEADQIVGKLDELKKAKQTPENLKEQDRLRSSLAIKNKTLEAFKVPTEVRDLYVEVRDTANQIAQLKQGLENPDTFILDPDEAEVSPYIKSSKVNPTVTVLPQTVSQGNNQEALAAVPQPAPTESLIMEPSVAPTPQATPIPESSPPEVPQPAPSATPTPSGGNGTAPYTPPPFFVGPEAPNIISATQVSQEEPVDDSWWTEIQEQEVAKQPDPEKAAEVQAQQEHTKRINKLEDEYARFSGNMPLALAAYNSSPELVVQALDKAGYTLKQAPYVKFDEVKKFLPASVQEYVPKTYNQMNARATKDPRQQTTGNTADVQSAVTQLIEDPSFAELSAPKQFEKLQEIYKSKDLWSAEANAIFKKLGTAIWEGAYSDEKPNIVGIAGSPPVFTEQDTPKTKQDKISHWRNTVDKKIRDFGGSPELLGDDYDKYFQDAATAEDEALKYRQRGIIGHTAKLASNVVQTFLGGAVSQYSSALAAAPRLLGAEKIADAIESAPLMFGTPSPDFFYEVDEETGRVKYDEYGKPISKLQASLASAAGQGIGLLGGGFAMKLGGVSLKAVTAAMGGVNVLATADSAFNDAIENNGTVGDARLAALFSVPSAAVDTLGDYLVLGGQGKAWLQGLSPLGKARYLVKMAEKAVPATFKEGITEGIQQQMQDMGTSAAIGKDITSARRDIEALAGGAFAGAAIGGVQGFVEETATSLGAKAAGATPGGSSVTTPKREREVFRAIFGNPDADEQRRLSSELTKFTKSADESTVLSYRSLADLDPDMFAHHGVDATIVSDSTVRVTRKTTPGAVFNVETEGDVSSEIDKISKSLADKASPTYEYAQKVLELQNKLNEEWRGISNRTRTHIAFYTSLVEDLKQKKKDLATLQQNKAAPEIIADKQHEIDVANIWFGSNPEIIKAVSIYASLRKNQYALRDLNKAEFPHDVKAQEKLLRNLLANRQKTIAGEEAKQKETAEAFNTKIQQLVEETTTLDKELQNYIEPKTPAESESFEKDLLRGVKEALRFGDKALASEYQSKYDRWQELKVTYKEDPELAKEIKNKFEKRKELYTQKTALETQQKYNQGLEELGKSVQGRTDVAPNIQGVPVQTKKGLKFVKDIGTAWQTVDANDVPEGPVFDYHGDAVRFAKGEEVAPGIEPEEAPKPLRPMEQRVERSPLPHPGATYTPSKIFTKTSKELVNPRDFKAAATKLVRRLVRYANGNSTSLSPFVNVNNIPPYSIHEGGRTKPGLHNKGYAGYASPWVRLMWLYRPNDLSTLAHELSHVIHFELIDFTNLPQNVQAALIDQALRYYGAPSLITNAMRGMQEGMAMFFENLCNGDPVHKEVLDWYNGAFKQRFPDVHKSMEEFKNLMHKYAEMDETTAVKAFSSAPAENKKSRTGFLTAWVDSMRILTEIDLITGGISRLRDLAEVVKGSAKTKVAQWTNTKVTDWEGVQIPGVYTFEEALAPAGKRIDDLIAYMVAKYTIARADGWNQTTGFNVEDSNKIIKTFDDAAANYHQVRNDLAAAETALRSDPNNATLIANRDALAATLKEYTELKGIADAANNIWAWNEAIMDLAAHRSTIFRAILDKIRNENQKLTGVSHGYNVPMHREFTEILDVPAGRARTETIRSPFARFRGSYRRVSNPLQAFKDRAVVTLDKANKNYVLRQLTHMAKVDQFPLSGWIRPVAKSSIVKLKTDVASLFEKMQRELKFHDQAEKQAFDDLVAQTPMMQAELLTFWTPETMPPAAADGYVTIADKNEDGSSSFFEVAPDLVRAFDDSLPDWINSPIIDWLWIRPNVLFKLGATTFRMAYQLRNLLFRDFATGYFRSGSNNPFGFARDVAVSLFYEFALSSGISKTKLGKKFIDVESSWVGTSNRLAVQSATMYHAGRDLDEQIEKKTGKKAITGLTKSLNYLENVLSSGERATRTAVMKTVAARQLGITNPNQALTEMQAIELALAYKRSTTNFQVQGREARKYNLGVPFFTARIAEISQLEKDWRDRKPRMISFALGFVALGIYQALANKDEEWWKNLMPEERFSNFLLPVGDKIVRIPHSSLGGIFNAVGNMMGEAIIADHLLKPELSENVFALAKNYMPLNFATVPGFPIPLPIDILGVPFKEVAQQVLNRDVFTNRAIVPRGLEEAPPSSQYTPATTELSKELGRILNYSPAKIDHAFRGLFPAGLDVLRQYENIAGVKPIKEQGEGILPVITSAFTRPGYISSSMDRGTEKFYNLAAKYRANKEIETVTEGNIRKALNKMQEQISAINIVLSAEPDQQTRSDLYAKKAKILEQGLAIGRGVAKPIVGKIAEERKAEIIRTERKAERATRQKELGEKDLYLE